MLEAALNDRNPHVQELASELLEELQAEGLDEELAHDD